MPEEHTYLYGDQAINYYVIGQGRPLLILHGWGSNAQVMMPLAQNLAHLRTCYIIDFPGFGKSPVPSKAWNIEHYADSLWTMIRDLNLELPDILAHSFGGRVILKLCARSVAKNKVGKILITGGAGMKPHRNVKFYFKKYLALILKFPFQLLPGALQNKGLSALRKTKLWKSLGSSDYRSLQGTMREIFVKTVTEYLETSLTKIDNEILLLWGKNDDTTPLYQAERMNKYLKNSALVSIENAGHYAFLDQPRQFKLIAEAFFKSD